MKYLVLALSLVACQKPEQPPPSTGSAAPVVNVQVVGCAPAAERPHAGKAGDTPVVPTGWFPYARIGETPADVAAPSAQKATAALVDKISDLDLCLTDKVGSVSLMLEIDTTGAIKPRVGGIGHHPTELCIAKLAAAFKLPAPAQATELECGLSAGAAGPLRVDVEGGYKLVEIAADAVTLAGKPAELDKPLEVTESVLVVAAPEIPADRLAKVLAWVSAAPAVLVAVKADGGPPVFLAMAPDRRGSTDDNKHVAIQVTNDELHACFGTQRDQAPVLEAKKVDAALEAIVMACGESCPEVIEVGVGGTHTTKQLIGATSAVRRAGRDPVLALGTRCK